MSWQDWLQAFLLTQVIEVPIWLAAARRVRLPRRLLVAVGASTVTHPVLWFAIPWGRLDPSQYWPTVAVAEAVVVAVEAAFAKVLGVRDAWLWSLCANATSVGLGLLVIQLVQK